MTNHWIDLQNCKTILVEGSNVAENHPMAFKWIRKAQENGAKIIHVDPRFTRTSAAADVYARIRPGTDAALQNTMINHILVNKLYDEDYVTTHTNALFLGDQAFDFKDGIFSGFDAENHKYHTETWGYQLDARGKPRVASAGCAPTALLVEHGPPWLSWSALIRDASDFSRAVVVAHVGATGEPVVRSVKV